VLKRPQAARLLAVDRDASSTRLLLLKRDETGVGSAQASGLCLADASVADRHAIIRYARGRYHVADLKSAEGTFVNGRRIRRKQELKHGDIVRFGSAAPYRFIDPDALKRRHWHRGLRASAVVAVLVAVVAVDRFEKWNLLSLSTATQIAAWMDSHSTSKTVDEPMNRVASAPAHPAASAAHAMPSPAAVASAAVVALAASTPKSPALLPSSNSSASSMTWLERLNFYRAGLGFEPIRDNSELSAAAAAHAHYLLLNFAEDIRAAKPMSGDAYDEKPGKSGYSASGARVARNLQIAWGCSSYNTGEQIDHWIEGPFHRLAMLDPMLTEAGFGEAASDGCWVATLRLPPPSEEARPYPRGIEFPPDNAAVGLDWIGVESPDPLASCSGYERPVGLPITLQIGRLVDTKLSAHSLTRDGKPIEYCAFDAPSYRNENPTAQEYGRWSLRGSGAVVIVPREPLQPGARYAVSITANDATYAWSFTVADNQTTTFTTVAKFPTPAPTPPPLAEPTARPRRTARPSHRATPAAAVSTTAPEVSAVTAPASSLAAEGSPAAAAAGSSTNWLAILNMYRTRLNVPPVEEDPALSSGCLAHARYLVENYEPILAGNINIGSLLHAEDQSKSGYSAEGLKAARASDVMFQAKGKMTGDQRMTRAVQSWIAGPFHRPQIVNPSLKQVGFAEYCGEKICVSSLDWRSDLPMAPVSGHALATPVEVPPGGATVKPSGFSGEWPNPVSGCPGYPKNAPAVTLQLGMWVPATIADASLTQTTGAAAGTKVATCPYDFQSYANDDPATQAQGREVLSSFGEAVMMVRDPLVPGETYRVNMTVSGKPYTWSFTAAP
jgi:uncharacterized protein YkwD